MAMRCMNCGKGVMYGHSVSHAKNRTNRTFKPNLHSVRVQVGVNKKRMKLCTKCLRLVKKATTSAGSLQASQKVEVAPVETPATA